MDDYSEYETNQNSSFSSGNSPIPSVVERLGQLRPSKELLEYYRKKIGEFDDEHEQMVAKLEGYKCTYEEQVFKFHFSSYSQTCYLSISK